MYAGYFSLSLFIGHILTCIGKLGYLSLSLVISHPLRALSRLPSFLLRPRDGQVFVTCQKLLLVGQMSGRSVCQSWSMRSVKGLGPSVRGLCRSFGGLCHSVGQSLGLINC